MVLTEALGEFFASDAGKAGVLVLVLALVDFVLGVAAAWRDNTFQLDAVAAWLRKHIAGRVFPIWVLLFAGHFTAGIQISTPIGDLPAQLPLLAIGTFAALTYIAEIGGSIMSSWGPKRDTQPVPID